MGFVVRQTHADASIADAQVEREIPVTLGGAENESPVLVEFHLFVDLEVLEFGVVLVGLEGDELRDEP